MSLVRVTNLPSAGPAKNPLIFPWPPWRKADGAGLNLTAADHVFLVDPWWNPAVEDQAVEDQAVEDQAVEDQAAGRAHRIGQERPVFVHRLVALGTVEERILALQAEKRALAEAALSGAERAAALTREDLLGLLE
jgi:SNF2 family DNA or RNA helicase